MNWSFRPPAWAVAGTLLGCAAFSWLGIWQIHRGEQKAAMNQLFAQALQQVPVELSGASLPAAGDHIVPVRAEGEYDGAHQLLIDNQVRNDVPGYDVWTPLQLAGGARLIVNRGWIAQGPDRHAPPSIDVPAGAVSVHGIWRSLPQAGVRLDGGSCNAGAPVAWPQLVLYPNVTDLRCLLGPQVADGELLLAPDAPGGYVREWTVTAPGFPPERHYAYAANWFAFDLTLLAIFLKLNLKRKR